MAVTVTDSVYLPATPQPDGRCWVMEKITLSTGAIVVRFYLAPSGSDRAAHLSSFTSSILDELAQNEIVANVNLVTTLGSVATLSLLYSTPTDNAAAIRAAWQAASKLDAIMIGDYLGGLSNAVLMVVFGFNLTQVLALRANVLTGAASVASAIRNAAGQ
jgi:hypothetical protein